MNLRFVLDSGAAEWLLAAGGTAAFLMLRPLTRGLPRPVLALRAAALLLLLGSLLKPSVHRLQDQLARPRLGILVDQGPSMNADDDQGRSRLERARRWLRAGRADLEERAEVTLLAASGGVRRLSWDELDALEPAPQALDPASAFSDLLGSGAPASRLWLLSDGAFARGDALSTVLARLNTPVDTLGIGPLRTRRSVSVAGITSPDFVFIHRRFDAAVAVETHKLQGGSVQVRLYRGQDRLAEKKLAVLQPYEVVNATFNITAQALGRQDYRLEIIGTPAEAGEQSVRMGREFGVEVIRQKYRIMYLAGRPSPEYSHLRAHLKSEPNHELVSFVILRNPENVSPVGDNELSLIPFPATEIFVTSLFEFDLFILENFAYWRFNLPVGYLQNLKRFVAQGGALLVIGGSNAFAQGGYRGTPLEETLPVTLWSNGDDFIPGLYSPEVAAPENPLLQLGASAAETEALWKALPPLDGFSRFASVRPKASVLLAHPSEKTSAGQPLPVVAVQEYGKGKVMLVGTDSTWRWKLGGGRDWRVSSFYGRFWNRAVQYLTGSLELKKVKFSPLPDRMPAREPAVLTVHVFDQHFRPVPGADIDLRVAWTTPLAADGQRTPAFFEVEPGVFQIELNDLRDGRHKVRAVVSYRGQHWGEDSVSFLWEKAKGAAPLNRKNLKAISDETAGRYADLERTDIGALMDSLPPVRRRKTVLSRSAVWTWNGWLWLLCGVLLAEWLIRRRRGYL